MFILCISQVLRHLKRLSNRFLETYVCFITTLFVLNMDVLVMPISQGYSNIEKKIKPCFYPREDESCVQHIVKVELGRCVTYKLDLSHHAFSSSVMCKNCMTCKVKRFFKSIYSISKCLCDHFWSLHAMGLGF